MVHKSMVIQQNLVKMFVKIINILHYKMEMVKQDGVLVIMKLIELLCMVILIVEKLEDNGVIML